MSQRHEKMDSVDDFPTPPWATRALIEHVIQPAGLDKLSCREPACGRGFMSRVLEEYFEIVLSSDANNYGFGELRDFILNDEVIETDWLITNPPFNAAEEFVRKGLSEARLGVAVLVRTVFLESVGRYNRLFSRFPPSLVAQFAERVPIVRGRVDPRASSATGYAWIVWEKTSEKTTSVVWIPPCRKTLERRDDYSFGSLNLNRKLGPVTSLQ